MPATSSPRRRGDEMSLGKLFYPNQSACPKLTIKNKRIINEFGYNCSRCDWWLPLGDLGGWGCCRYHDDDKIAKVLAKAKGVKE